MDGWNWCFPLPFLLLLQRAQQLATGLGNSTCTAQPLHFHIALPALSERPFVCVRRVDAVTHAASTRLTTGSWAGRLRWHSSTAAPSPRAPLSATCYQLSTPRQPTLSSSRRTGCPPTGLPGDTLSSSATGERCGFSLSELGCLLPAWQT